MARHKAAFSTASLCVNGSFMNITKATAVASIVYLVFPVAFLTMGWHSMQSPDWGTDDSGAVQGFAFFALAGILSLVCVAVAFPLVAIKLKSGFTARRWVWSNIFLVLIGSYLLSCLFCYYMGATSTVSILLNAAVLSVLISITGIVMLAPAMFVWLRIAKVTHNKSN